MKDYSSTEILADLFWSMIISVCIFGTATCVSCGMMLP